MRNASKIAAVVSFLCVVPCAAVTIVVDNGNAAFHIVSGTWNTGSSGTPWGGDYRWCGTTGGAATHEAEWRPALPVSGAYEVAVYFVAGANRSTGAPFTVEHAGGSVTIPINQQVSDQTWLGLGVYRFAAGSAGRVRLTNAAPASVVIADAVRFRFVEPVFDVDGDNDDDVDPNDFNAFQACLDGADQAVGPGCEAMDLDGDGDADLGDYGWFQACFSGPNVPAAVGCRTAAPWRDPFAERSPGAPTGSAFVAEVGGLSLTQREQRIQEEILAGNVPGFLRRLWPVHVSAGGHEGTYFVTPDYLCIGSDADFVRMPMTPLVAQPIADALGCLLTTRKMTNDVYAQATVKLAPSPISPQTTDITLVSTFVQHHQTIEGQRAGIPLGPLVAGIKKDVVITPQLATNPGKVAIYGWHQLSGVPIQPLYLGHGIQYVDYSHGIRLVAGTMLVDGVPMPVADVLADPSLAGLLSDEGVIANPSY